MSVSKLMTCCASAPILAMLAFGVAHAEGSGGDAPKSQVEEVVVTALKRATTVQNTPLAITALTDQALNKMGASTVADLVRQRLVWFDTRRAPEYARTLLAHLASMGWRPAWDLKAALRQTYEWFVANEATLEEQAISDVSR